MKQQCVYLPRNHSKTPARVNKASRLAYASSSRRFQSLTVVQIGTLLALGFQTLNLRLKISMQFSSTGCHFARNGYSYADFIAPYHNLVQAQMRRLAMLCQFLVRRRTLGAIRLLGLISLHLFLSLDVALILVCQALIHLSMCWSMQVRFTKPNFTFNRCHFST